VTGFQVGTKVRFRNQTWTVAKAVSLPERLDHELGFTAPYLRLADIDDGRHQVTLLEGEWGRIHLVMP
jgi:hypothetical protein